MAGFKILKTIDMGKSFMSLEPPVDKTPFDVCFANDANGYFVGMDGIIIHLFDSNNVIKDDEYSLDRTAIRSLFFSYQCFKIIAIRILEYA